MATQTGKKLQQRKSDIRKQKYICAWNTHLLALQHINKGLTEDERREMAVHMAGMLHLIDKAGTRVFSAERDLENNG